MNLLPKIASNCREDVEQTREGLSFGWLVFYGLLVGRGLDTPEAPRAAAVYSWKGSQPSQYHPVHKEDMTPVGVGRFRKVACLCQANPDSVVALQSPQSSRFQHPGCQSAHAVAMKSVPPALTHHLDDEEGPKSHDHKQQKKDAADDESDWLDKDMQLS